MDEIPNTVIAEAVNNAIAHRNYASIGSIQVEVYSDRVEVISPGRLHRAITVAELYKKHESFATNPRIARAMYQVKYIETIGTGLTDLLEECKKKRLRTPLLEEMSGRFRIVIWRPSASNVGGATANNPQIKKVKDSEIIAIMLDFPHLSVAKLADKLQIKYQVLRYRLDQFKRVGILKREGARKNGRWVLTSKFAGYGADGQVIVNEELELDATVYTKLRKRAGARGVPVEDVVSQIVQEEVKK